MSNHVVAFAICSILMSTNIQQIYNTCNTLVCSIYYITLGYFDICKKKRERIKEEVLEIAFFFLLINSRMYI